MAISQRQLEANRRNAQRSTGPRTEEGKARVSMNALRHGMRTESALLPHEDPELLEELHADTHDRYQPQTLEELRYVDELVLNDWRLRRFHEMEVRVLTPHYEPQPETEAEGQIQARPARRRDLLDDMLRLSRYHGSLYRTRDRLLKELDAVQAAREEAEQQEPERAAEPAATQEPAHNHPTDPSQLPPDLARRWPRDHNGNYLKPNLQQQSWQNFFKLVAERTGQAAA